MKKIFLILLVVLVTIGSAFALDLSGLKWVGYVGGSFQQSSVAGLMNARLSDYQYYGGSEGSLYLPLESANGNRMLFGVVAGAKAYLAERIGVLAEVGYSFGGEKTFAINANIGGLFYFINSNFHLGAGAKLGLFDYNVFLGSARILPGTTPPVILPQGTIRNGDILTYSIMGLNVNPVVDISYDIGSISVGASVGYQFGFSFKSSLTANKISIDPKTSGAFYDPEAIGFRRIEMDPKVSLNGFTAQLVVSYKF